MSTSLPSDAGADCAAGASSDFAGADSLARHLLVQHLHHQV